jgi:hypothetical protein
MEDLRPYGIRNEATGYEVSIDPGDGTLLIFRYHSGLFKWVDELSIKLKRKR